MSAPLRPAADRSARSTAALGQDAGGVAAGRRRGAGRRVGAAPALAARLHRPAQGGPPAGPGARGRQAARPAAGPRAAVRPARAGQDQPRPDHRLGARHVGEDHQRSGHRALRRPRRDAVQPRARRRAVHRRDPPHRPARRGTALHGDGGLPGRRRRRQGARAPRPSRWRSTRSPWSAPPPGPGLLTGPLRDRFGFVGQMEFYEPAELQQVLAPQRRPAGRRADRRRARPRSPAARAARPASPTGCCAGCATTPRSRPTAG